MLKVEHLESCGWEAAIRGMRNPLNSWDKSDTLFIDRDGDYYTIFGDTGPYCGSPSFMSQGFELGDNDLALMRKLIKAGTDHAKFMRQIGISLDIVAPLYWWKEMDTYKVGTVANSCSTMHKIASKVFDFDDFSHEHLFGGGAKMLSPITDIFTEEQNDGNEMLWTPNDLLSLTIRILNHYRKLFVETGDKAYWWQMIQLLPTSYNQKRTVTLNYAAARNMYHARSNHKLDEWHQLCAALEQLPYAKELIVE